MVIPANSRLAAAFAYVRAHGVKSGLEVVFNFVLPFLVFNFGSAGLGNAGALMAASAPPILWTIVGFVRERRIDAISLLVLSGIALSLIAFAGGGGVKFLQLRENLVGGLVGLIFLGSLVIGKPLIYQLARAGVRRRAAEHVAAVEALGGDRRFRGDMALATLVWAVGLLASCAVHCVLVFMLSIRLFLLISGPITYAVIGGLTAWTFWYVPRAMRQVGDRRTAAADSENRVESDL
jgi:hypothetical protein